MIRHIYVHIPFCARICPYCAFYKDLLDRSQTWRFCEAVLRDLDLQRAHFAISPSTIYFGGGTPTALMTAQLEFLLEAFADGSISHLLRSGRWKEVREAFLAAKPQASKNSE